MFAFPHQKIVVTATVLFRKIATGRRAMFVDSAVSFFLVKKHAGGFENVILTMPEYASLVFLFILGKFLFGLFVCQAESFGQALDITFCDSDPIV